jgi:exonuclease VII small subunit
MPHSQGESIVSALSDLNASLEAEVVSLDQRVAAHVADLSNKLADAEKKVVDVPTAEEIEKTKSLIERIKVIA